MKRVLRLLLPPHFPEDENKTRISSLIWYSLLVILVTGAIFPPLLAGLSDSEAQTKLAYISTGVITVVICAGLLGAVRRGYVRFAAIVLTLFLYLTMTYILYPAGAGGRAASMYALLIVAAGVLVGPRAALGFAVLSTATLVVLLYAEQTGRLVLGPWPPAGIADIILQGAVYSLSAILVYIATQNLTSAIIRAQTHERELVTTNLELEALKISLEQRIASRTRGLAASIEVSRFLSTILDPNDLATAVVAQLKKAYNYDHVNIYLWDEPKEFLVLSGGTGEAGKRMLAANHQIPAGKGLVGRAAEQNKVILIADTLNEPGWLPNELLPETRAEMVVPISIGKNVMGVLDVQQNVVGGLTEDDMQIIQSIANQVAIGFENARSFTRAQFQADRETRLNQIGQRLQSAVTVENALEVAVQEVAQYLNAKQVNVRLGLRQNRAASNRK